MMHRPGPRLTLAQKTEVWRRWRQGESLSAIGRHDVMHQLGNPAQRARGPVGWPRHRGSARVWR